MNSIEKKAKPDKPTVHWSASVSALATVMSVLVAVAFGVIGFASKPAPTLQSGTITNSPIVIGDHNTLTTINNNVKMVANCGLEPALQAIVAQDAPRTLEIFRCNPTLRSDRQVHLALRELVATPDKFKISLPYLMKLRAGGVNIVRNISPAVSLDLSGEFATPLAEAAENFNVAAVEWLLADTQPKDLKRYPHLVPDLISAGGVRVGSWASYADALKVLSILVKHGAPFDDNDYRAYQQSVQNYARAAAIMVQDTGDRERSPHLQESFEFWKSVYVLVAPPEPQRTDFFRLESGKVRAKSMATLESEIKSHQLHLDGQGLGFDLVGKDIVVRKQLPPEQAEEERQRVQVLERQRAQLESILPDQPPG